MKLQQPRAEAVAALDEKLSEQINQIIHHADYQKLEGSWRGLHYMVNNTETDEMLKILKFIGTDSYLSMSFEAFVAKGK